MSSPETTDAVTTRMLALESVVRLASEAWSHLETMYREQDEMRKVRGSVHSGPRDKFESYLDALTTDAQEALK